MHVLLGNLGIKTWPFAKNNERIRWFRSANTPGFVVTPRTNPPHSILAKSSERGYFVRFLKSGHINGPSPCNGKVCPLFRSGAEQTFSV